MRDLLISQQFEMSYHEALSLAKEISRWLYRPVTVENKLQPFEVLGAVYLKSAGRKLAQRLVGRKPKVQKFRLSFSAQEIIALRQIIITYPEELSDFLVQLDRKALNYDQVVHFDYKNLKP